MLCLPDPCHRLQAASPLTPGTRHTASPAPRHPPGTPGNRCFRGWLLGPQILKTRILSPYSAPSVPGQGRLRGVCGNAVLCSDSEILEQRKQDRRPSCRTGGIAGRAPNTPDRRRVALPSSSRLLPCPATRRRETLPSASRTQSGCVHPVPTDATAWLGASGRSRGTASTARFRREPPSPRCPDDAPSLGE